MQAYRLLISNHHQKPYFTELFFNTSCWSLAEFQNKEMTLWLHLKPGHWSSLFVTTVKALPQDSVTTVNAIFATIA